MLYDGNGRSLIWCRLLQIQTDAVVEVCHCDEDAMTCFNHVEKCAAPYLPECYGQRMSDDCDGDRSRRSPRRSAAQAADFRAQVQKDFTEIERRMRNDRNPYQEFVFSELFLSRFLLTIDNRRMHNEPKHDIITPRCSAVG